MIDQTTCHFNMLLKHTNKTVRIETTRVEKKERVYTMSLVAVADGTKLQKQSALKSMVQFWESEFGDLLICFSM